MSGGATALDFGRVTDFGPCPLCHRVLRRPSLKDNAKIRHYGRPLAGIGGYCRIWRDFFVCCSMNTDGMV